VVVRCAVPSPTLSIHEAMLPDYGSDSIASLLGPLKKGDAVYHVWALLGPVPIL
jgi:hypothetical protein